MTEKRYKEIENILNNIQYTRKEPPKTGSYFKSKSLYSNSIPIEFGSEITDYLKRKYGNILKQAVCTLETTNNDNKIIIFYDSDMVETKIVMPFNTFYYDDGRELGWQHFLSDGGDYEHFYNDDNTITLRITHGKLNSKTMQDAKIKINENSAILSFALHSKELDTTFTFNTRLWLDENYDFLINVLHTNIFNHYLYKKLENIYSRQSELFDLYDNLSDEKKLKLKLTGKLL